MQIAPAPGVIDAVLPALRRSCAALSALHGAAIGTILLGREPHHNGTPSSWSRVFVPKPQSQHARLAQQRRLRTGALAQELHAAGKGLRVATLPLFGSTFLPSDTIFDHVCHGHPGNIRAIIMGRRFSFPHHCAHTPEGLALLLAQVHTIVIRGRDPLAIPPPCPLWLDTNDSFGAIDTLPGATETERRENHEAMRLLEAAHTNVGLAPSA